MNKACTNDGCSCTPNNSIECSVNSCAHHCKDEDYCGLNSIRVGSRETDPNTDACTDCRSFRKF